jgi:uncharacterized membrane protein YjjP (DUF1212 family)
MRQTKKVLDLAVLAGKILMNSGAEVFRVEETMIRIVNAYGIKCFDIFVLTNGIVATIEDGEEEFFAKVNHIPVVNVHLGKVSAVNNLSRSIVDGKYSVDEAYEELLKIEGMPIAKNLHRILASGVGSACFCYIFSGTLFDSILAFVLGVLLYLFIIYIEKKNLSKVLVNLLGSILVAAAAVVLFNSGLGNKMDKIIIGAIIPLVPGVAFTNSIRHFIDGDYLSGVILLLDALLISACIAAGVGIVLNIYNHLLTGGIL